MVKKKSKKKSRKKPNDVDKHTAAPTEESQGPSPAPETPVSKHPDLSPLQEKLHEIIFEAETPAGKAFDVILLILISASILVVMLESVVSLRTQYGRVFDILEWSFTIFFTIEYLLRIYCVSRSWKYIFSFYGIIDLLAILPAYAGLFIANTQSLLIVRALRIMRIFRVFKLGHFMNEGKVITNALKASRAKLTVFLTFVLLIVMIIGSLMYLIETGPKSDFTNIPRSVYWAIVSLTTVGYGDIAPKTAPGQFLASIVMIIGYAVIAVPTGIVSAEIIKDANQVANTVACMECSAEGHDSDAVYCKYCGTHLGD